MQIPEESPTLSHWPLSTPQPEIRSPAPSIPKNLFKPSRLVGSITEEQQGFHRGPMNRRKGRVLMIFSWTAALMDAAMVVGIGMIFLSLFFLVQRNYPLNMGLLFLKDRQILCVLFVMLSFIYMIMLRSVLGFSLGEWACSLRMGTTLERISKYYPFRVVLRTVLLFATGIIVLPILSLCFGRDLAGSICGVRLNSLK